MARTSHAIRPMPNPRVVVIGTGAGGLAACVYLAKEGFDVLALEQARKPGGLLGGFRREGYGFDPGVHYVGSCGPGGIVRSVLEPIGLDTDALFTELDPTGFDAFRFPDLEVRMPRGLEAFREQLARAFPASDLEICDFLSMVRGVRDLMHLGVGDREPGTVASALLNLPSVLRWSRSSYAELLDHLVGDPRLRAVLSAPIGDDGLPPSRASAVVVLELLAHYADGAFFPRGGSATLRDAFVDRARTLGVEIRTEAKVVKLHANARRVVAVELEGGERIEADYVVSDVDPRVTFDWIEGGPSAPRRVMKKLGEVTSSLAPFLLFLGMKRDIRERKMGRFNVWSYPSWDVEAAYAPQLRGELPDDPALFLSPGSLKDDSGALAPKGCSTLEVLTFVPYQRFAPFEAAHAASRGGRYEDLKKRIEEQMLAALDARFPGLVGDVEVCESASPLAFRSWVGAVDGGAYGPASTPHFWGPFRFESKTWLPNLFLAGSGVLGHGVAPCLLSGKMAAARVDAAVKKIAEPGWGSRILG